MDDRERLAKLEEYCDTICTNASLCVDEDIKTCPIHNVKMSLELDKDYFKITSMHRDDLEGQGYDVSNIDDDTMAELADRMADAYTENTYWIDLDCIADDMDIPKKGQKDESDEEDYKDESDDD